MNGLIRFRCIKHNEPPTELVELFKFLIIYIVKIYFAFLSFLFRSLFHIFWCVMQSFCGKKIFFFHIILFQFLDQISFVNQQQSGVKNISVEDTAIISKRILVLQLITHLFIKKLSTAKNLFKIQQNKTVQNKMNAVRCFFIYNKLPCSFVHDQSFELQNLSFKKR